jgi:hypothetical protein
MEGFKKKLKPNEEDIKVTHISSDSLGYETVKNNHNVRGRQL